MHISVERRDLGGWQRDCRGHRGCLPCHAVEVEQLRHDVNFIVIVVRKAGDKHGERICQPRRCAARVTSLGGYAAGRGNTQREGAHTERGWRVQWTHPCLPALLRDDRGLLQLAVCVRQGRSRWSAGRRGGASKGARQSSGGASVHSRTAVPRPETCARVCTREGHLIVREEVSVARILVCRPRLRRFQRLIHLVPGVHIVPKHGRRLQGRTARAE